MVKDRWFFRVWQGCALFFFLYCHKSRGHCKLFFYIIGIEKKQFVRHLKLPIGWICESDHHGAGTGQSLHEGHKWLKLHFIERGIKYMQVGSLLPNKTGAALILRWKVYIWQWLFEHMSVPKCPLKSEGLYFQKKNHKATTIRRLNSARSICFQTPLSLK